MVTNRRAALSPRPRMMLLIGDRRWYGLAVVPLLACLAVLALFLRLPVHTQGPRSGLLVLAAGSLLFVRRWPLPALALAGGVVAMAVGFVSVPLPLGLILGVAAYTAGSRLPRRVSIPAVTTAAAILGAAIVLAAITRQQTPAAADAVEVLVPLLAGWIAGDSAAARRRYLAGLAEQAERERVIEAERARREVAEERVRIARELHDVIAHSLAVITVQAGVGRRLMARDPGQAASALESIETTGRTAQEELRVVLGLLREGEHGPAALAPAPGLQDLTELAQTVRAAGTPVDLHVPDADHRLSPALELSVYRVVQEALTNVVKHAPGARATVDLAITGGEVSVAITDDGVAVTGPCGGLTGHGIAGMRERVGAFGGSLLAQPSPGRGFRVLARIPVQDGA